MAVNTSVAAAHVDRRGMACYPVEHDCHAVHWNLIVNSSLFGIMMHDMGTPDMDKACYACTY